MREFQANMNFLKRLVKKGDIKLSSSELAEAEEYLKKDMISFTVGSYRFIN